MDRAPDASRETIHLIEPPRLFGGADRGRESSLVAFSLLRARGLVEPGPVVVVGDASSFAAARAHGIEHDARLVPPAGRPGLCWRAIRRLTARSATVRCWSPAMLRVAAAATPSRVRVRATLVSGSASAWDRRAVARLGDRLERVDVFDPADAAAWSETGVPADSIHTHQPEQADLPPPGARVRLKDQSEGELVLTMLADHPREADARRFSFLLAILSVGEYACVGLSPAGARHMEAGRRYHRNLGNPHAFQVSDRPMIELLRAADMCVWPDPTRRDGPRGARRLLEALAARHGVTIIDPPEYADPAGPTPPEMVRPALRLFERGREGAVSNQPPVMAGSGA